MNTKRRFPDDSSNQPLPSYKDFHTKETNIEVLLAQVTPKQPNTTPQQQQSNKQNSQKKPEDKPRVFIFVHGEPGASEHNVGRQHQLAAETHARELEKGIFPYEGGGPQYRKGKDIIKVVAIKNVKDLVNALGDGNVAYLAYFGHSGIMRREPQDPPGTVAMKRHGAGALFIGDGATPGANLTNQKGSANTSVTAIPKDKFTEDAQIRLFGCRAGLGHPPIAQQLAEHLEITVHAYISRGGSLFTMDKDLGHGKRALKKGEQDKSIGNVTKGTDLWQVTFGSPVDVNNNNINTNTAWKKFESSAPKKEHTQTQNKQQSGSPIPNAPAPDTQPSDGGMRLR